jgi:phage terminase large subunit GpA-like protein
MVLVKRVFMKITNPLTKGVNNGFMPDPRLTVTEWSDKYRILTSEASAEAGRWRTDRTPYLKEIMDEMSPNSPTQQVKVIKGTQLGFALDINTPIPTPTGFKNMLYLKVGDKVYDELGVECMITNTSPIYTDHDCYMVTFSDGSEFVADAGHKWTVDRYVGSTFKRYETITTNTKSMSKDFKQGVRNRYAIDVCEPIQGFDNDIRVNPYYLGLWLGAGTTSSNTITAELPDAIEYTNILNALGMLHRFSSQRGKVVTISFGVGKGNICRRGHNKDEVGRTQDGTCRCCHNQRSMYHHYGKARDPIINNAFVTESLRELGVLNNKHIPLKYLRADKKTRLDVLDGLIDSDGHIREDGLVEFYNLNRRLVDDTFDLIAGLGFKPKISKKKQHQNDFVKNPHEFIYRITFMAYKEKPVSKLPRKLNRLKSMGDCRITETFRRRVINIEKVQVRDVKCISVDSPSNLFLAGKSYIPTHNSSIADNMVMCYLDLYPCPILYMLPTETLAKGTSKRRITPSMRAIPHLAQKITGGKSKDDIGETFTKAVAGGNLSFGWSNSTSSFRSFSARLVILDDCDGYGSFGEGDVLGLGKARADAFSNKKIYINSTPTVAGNSNIETEFEDSDQREYDMPCPECKVLMPFKWEYMQYEVDTKGALKGDVKCSCPNCGYLIDEYKKTDMMLNGIWQPRNVGHIHRGYKLTSFYSPHGWLGWNEIAIAFIKAYNLMLRGDDRLMQVWKNTRNAECWMPKLDGVDIVNPHERVEDYGGEVPNEVYMLTCGIDTQNDRFELEVLGHGRNNQTYSIDYKVIAGDPKFEETQALLDNYLASTFKRVDGTLMKISGTCIDSGGHRTKAVYAYAKARTNNNVFAIKGANVATAPLTNKTIDQMIPNELTLFSIGVTVIKDAFLADLAITQEGANYCHFPLRPVYDSKYFKMLTAEKRDAKGDYVKIRVRNEALDCRVYALAVLAIMDIIINHLPVPILYVGKQGHSPTYSSEQGVNMGEVTSHMDEF